MSASEKRSGFSQSLHHCFANYCNFIGRTSRSDFWLFILLLLLTGIFFGVIVGIFGARSMMALPRPPHDAMVISAYAPFAVNMTFYIYFGLLMSIVHGVTLVPFAAACVRRLHDAGRSGWWLLLSLTIIGLLPLFIFFCLKSRPEENRYGACPYAH